MVVGALMIILPPIFLELKRQDFTGNIFVITHTHDCSSLNTASVGIEDRGEIFFLYSSFEPPLSTHL